MKPITRKTVYGVLIAINTVLVGAVQQGLVPAHYAQAVALATMITFAAMKAITSATDTSAPADAAPTDQVK